MDDRIIVIDDDPDYLDILRRRLARAGYRDVTPEADPCQAAERFAGGERFHLAIIDVNMPDMDGIEATRRIKADWPQVRVIALSMVDDDQVSRTMREAGAEAFVSKTASSTELLKTIYGICRGN